MASLMMYAIERSLHALRLVEMTIGVEFARDDMSVIDATGTFIYHTSHP